MISCKRATELLSLQMDEDLSTWQRLVLRFHLMMCTNCREFSRQMDRLRSFSSRFMERSSINSDQNIERDPITTEKK